MAPPKLDLKSLVPKRVCLIKPSSLGDVVHALPVLGSLRTLWPESHLAWVVNRGLRGLLDGHPWLDEVITFDRGSVSLTPGGIYRFGRFLNELRRKEFDLAIDLQGLLRSGLMLAATGAGVRVGMSDAREGASRFATHSILMSAAQPHAVDRLMAVAESFGGDPSRRFVVANTREDRLWASRALAGLRGPRVVFNLGARWLTKRWPPASFAQVARRVATERAASLIAVGAPEDRPLVDEWKAGLDGFEVLDLCGRTTLPQLAAIAAEADLFVSNDTGPLHLAAASGGRVLGIYTCTSPAKTGPYGPNAEAIASRIYCAASCVKSCPRMECMTELSADRVAEAVLRRLTSPSAARHAS